jgi:hypothetical protein
MRADAKPTLEDVGVNPAFVAAAKTIFNKDEFGKILPPDWLVDGLDHFSGFVGGDAASSIEKKETKKKLLRMQEAVRYLMKTLPLFANLPLGIRCPDDVAVALVVLPKIETLLEYATTAPTRKGGQNPNIPRKFCAAVVVEAWRIVHGKPEPESPKLWTACNEYWQACGRSYRGGDVDTWREDCRDAANNPIGLISDVLSLLKTGRN